jgi:hypothetical protein
MSWQTLPDGSVTELRPSRLAVARVVLWRSVAECAREGVRTGLDQTSWVTDRRSDKRAALAGPVRAYANVLRRIGMAECRVRESVEWVATEALRDIQAPRSVVDVVVRWSRESVDTADCPPPIRAVALPPFAKTWISAATGKYVENPSCRIAT